ncbi:MAG: HAMP domain-containing histidine kinase [Tannerella sp.]|jgi:signal transduction histidine kinase|nr:HAMP domain-containing histidine kinase [Tannerella sp.]
MQEVDLPEVLNTQLYYLSYLAEDKGINLEVKVNSSLLIMANHFLLEGLINNLIINAITYNKEKGSLQIAVDDKKLIVSNSGEKMPLNPTKIFQRFNQTSEKNKKGNGLGLSIVYQICKFHGWKISYDYPEDKHTFTICF